MPFTIQGNDFVLSCGETGCRSSIKTAIPRGHRSMTTDNMTIAHERIKAHAAKQGWGPDHCPQHK